MADDFDPEADFIPTPRRTKTKKTEAIRLLADIEFDGPMIEPGREDHYSENARKEEQNKRDEYVMKYGCVVPDDEMLEFIAKYTQGEKVMEPCAGTGLLAYLLNAMHDVDIIASDDQPSKINIYGQVETLNAVETVRKYNDERGVLLLCWPPLLDVDHEAVMRPRQKTDLHRRDSRRQSRQRKMRRHARQILESRRQNRHQDLVLRQGRKCLHLREEEVGGGTLDCDSSLLCYEIFACFYEIKRAGNKTF